MYSCMTSLQAGPDAGKAWVVGRPERQGQTEVDSHRSSRSPRESGMSRHAHLLLLLEMRSYLFTAVTLHVSFSVSLNSVLSASKVFARLLRL